MLIDRAQLSDIDLIAYLDFVKRLCSFYRAVSCQDLITVRLVFLCSHTRKGVLECVCVTTNRFCEF